MIQPHRISPYPADRLIRSPNHGARSGLPISLIILHGTADGGSEKGAESWMQNPKSEASCHLHFRRDGSITRLVDDKRRAWHAGVSSWPGILDVNSESLGWEIANREDGKEPFTAAQYRAVADALRHYLPQGIERSGVLGHYDVAPGRKTDPRGWDWVRMWLELAMLEVEPRIVTIPPRPPVPDLREVEPSRSLAPASPASPPIAPPAPG